MPNAPTLNPRLDPKGSNFVVTFRHPLHGGKLVCRGLKTSDETDAQSVCIDARRLFERETALYREVVSRIAAHRGRYRSLADLLTFIEQETSRALSLRRVKIAAHDILCLTRQHSLKSN